MRDVLADLPEVEADSGLERRIRHGDAAALGGIVPAGATLFKVLYEGRLLAIASAEPPAAARLIRVFGAETPERPLTGANPCVAGLPRQS